MAETKETKTEEIKDLARRIALTPHLDDERRVKALENFSQGLYTPQEIVVFTEFHITSISLKLFFLTKNHKMGFADWLCSKNRASFVVAEGDAEFPDERTRYFRAQSFMRAEATTIVKAELFFIEDGKALRVMWVDPILMKISLEEECKEIQRNLYQTDRLEPIKWTRIRIKKDSKILMPVTDPN